MIIFFKMFFVSLDALIARRKQFQIAVDAINRSFAYKFGHPIDYLLDNLHLVESLFDSEDPESRCLAISFVGHKLPLNVSYNRLLQAVRVDPSPSVRITTIYLLGQIFKYTETIQIVEVLKDIARNSSEDNCIRKSAYLAVTRFNSRGQYIHAENFNFPDEAEWVFFDGVQALHF